MSPSFKLMTVAVATAAAVALPLSAGCSVLASPGPAAGGGSAHGAHGSGSGIDQGPTTPATSAPAVKPGLAGTAIMLDSDAELFGYDVAIDASGRAYVGWISDRNSGRKIHLCTLPPGAKQCAGGIQTVLSPATSDSATALQVLATPGGKVTLVWMHDTFAAENGPQADEIATATSQRGGPLSKPTDVATAPSFGTMFDATFGPNDSIWVVTERSSAGGIQVREGLSGPFVNLHTPYGVGGARLRFSDGTGVLVIQKAGSIGTPVDAGSFRNGDFSGFSEVADTWTAGAVIGLTATTSGIRMITSVDNATYHPESWSWGGSGFGQPTLTGDLNNCAPSSHDLVSDASGRVADASEECSDVAIANLSDTRHAVVTRFPVRGTFAGGPPQLATTPRGTGWVAWSIEGTIADKLFVTPIVLPGLVVTSSAPDPGN